MTDEQHAELIARRAAALTSAPIGCAFLTWAEILNLGPAAAVDPLTTLYLSGRAICDTDVWRGDYPAAVEKLLRDGPRLLPLARAVLAQPETAWWFAPLDRSAQLFAYTPGGTSPPPPFVSEPRPPVIPDDPPTQWERYAQKPEWALYTSTEIAGLSSYLANAAETVGDLGPLTYPAPRYRLTASASARVYEIDGPAAWRRLCLTYPAPEPGGLELSFADPTLESWLHGDLVVPDFAAVARDWDAVHLSLGGILTGAQFRLSGPEGATELQGWEAEQTVWLRWSFADVDRLPDLTERPAPPTIFR